MLKRVGKITGVINLRERELLLAKQREAQAHAEKVAVREDSAVKEDAIVKEKAAVEEEPTINTRRRIIQDPFHSLKNTYTADILPKFRELDKIPKKPTIPDSRCRSFRNKLEGW